ncbi:MAG: lipid-A-disaccharide synthase [Acidobacteria bacterium]|nr:lipid-A-disaccharide synthase [Acidobacteriota bacterium]
MRVMVSCGEPSGDLYAGALTQALRSREPGLDVFGFGGPLCREAGVRLIGDYTGLSVTGLTEAVRVLPATYAMLRRLGRAAAETPPDALVVVDYPDFNFRLMSLVAARGVPVVYYVTPQLWAWRPGRMKAMQRDVALALPIFPFEAPLYEKAGVPVRFLGHPLVDRVPAPSADPAEAARHQQALRLSLGLVGSRPVVALLPGSRHNELARLVPVVAAALPAIGAAVPAVQFIVASAPGRRPEEFAAILAAAPTTPVVQHRTDDVLAAADVVITASGTATAQTALHERPMVVIYKLSPLTYALGKPLVTVDTYAMANLIAGERVVPELIQDGCTPEAIAAETIAYLREPERWATTRTRLAETRAKLGPPGATDRIADAVLAVARRLPVP